jgi:hypothetical protein
MVDEPHGHLPASAYHTDNEELLDFLVEKCRYCVPWVDLEKNSFIEGHELYDH